MNPLESPSDDLCGRTGLQDRVRTSGFAGTGYSSRPVSRPVSRPSSAVAAGPEHEISRSSGVSPFRKPAQIVRPKHDDYDFVPSPVMQLAPGQRVEHNRFGFGYIREITGDAAGKKARIAFDDYGEKILMLNYAKIRIVGIGKK